MAPKHHLHCKPRTPRFAPGPPSSAVRSTLTALPLPSAPQRRGCLAATLFTGNPEFHLAPMSSLIPSPRFSAAHASHPPNHTTAFPCSRSRLAGSRANAATASPLLPEPSTDRTVPPGSPPASSAASPSPPWRASPLSPHSFRCRAPPRRAAATGGRRRARRPPGSPPRSAPHHRWSPPPWSQPVDRAADRLAPPPLVSTHVATLLPLAPAWALSSVSGTWST